LGDSGKYPYPYHRWYLGILRERAVSWTGIRKVWGGGGGNTVWNSKSMRGFSSKFPEGEDGESFA